MKQFQQLETQLQCHGSARPQQKGRRGTSVTTLNGASQNFDCTLDPQEKDLLNDGFENTELAASPVSQTPCSQLKQPDQNNCTDIVESPDLAQGATQARKQRALDKSREAQKRFRVRQKVKLLCRQMFLQLAVAVWPAGVSYVDEKPDCRQGLMLCKPSWT